MAERTISSTASLSTKRPSNALKPSRSTKQKKRYGEIDLSFFLILMILLVMGIVMMFSASYAWAIDEGLDGTFYAVKQLRMAGIGLVAMFVFSYIDYHKYQKAWIAFGSYIGCVILLVLVLVMGNNGGGATRWLSLGPIPSFQPSELMKLSIIICFSFMISRNYKKMSKFTVGIIPYMLMLGVVAALMMMQPHLSGTLLICIIAVTLIFIGGVKITHMMVLGGIGVVGIIAVVLKKMSEGYGYFQTRIQSWLDPFADIQQGTWQTCQSLIAIGSGGLFGLGLGESRQKYMYLPESKNDFVFAIVCEELGFVGAVAVILLFVLFVFRGTYIASKAPDKFGMLIAAGITAQVGYQALINIAVVSNLVPNTGISLPFFSYGGTALVMQLAEMGILLNISRQANLET